MLSKINYSISRLFKKEAKTRDVAGTALDANTIKFLMVQQKSVNSVKKEPFQIKIKPVRLQKFIKNILII